MISNFFWTFFCKTCAIPQKNRAIPKKTRAIPQKLARFLKKLARFLKNSRDSSKNSHDSSKNRTIPQKLVRSLVLVTGPSHPWKIIENTIFIWKYSEIWTKMPALGPGLVPQKIPSLVQVLGSWAIDWAEKERDRSIPWGVESRTLGRTDVQTIAYFFKIWKYAKKYF